MNFSILPANFGRPALPELLGPIATAPLPPEISRKIGRRLRELRCERNYTELRVAWDCGLDPRFIRDVEHGHVCLTLPILQLIAAGLNLELSELFQPSYAPTCLDGPIQ